VSFSDAVDGTERVREEDSGAVDELMFSFDVSMTIGDSFERSSSCERRSSKVVVRVGASRISGS
jgi:hypothetical protein